MKIVIFNFHAQQSGGIASCLKYHFLGFKELGHEVKIYELVRSNKANKPYREPDFSSPNIHYNKPLDVSRCDIKSKELVDIIRWADFILMEKACPSKSKHYLYLKDWPVVYRIAYRMNIPTGVIWHDPWSNKYYSWFQDVVKYQPFIFPIHYASYGALVSYFPDLERVKIIPFPIDFNVIPWQEKINGTSTIFSCSVWKEWSRVHNLVMAAPFLRKAKLITASKGITKSYMTSQKKNNIRFTFYSKNIPLEEYRGKRVWDVAVESGNFKDISAISEKIKFDILSEGVDHCVNIATSKNWLGNTVRFLIESVSAGNRVLTTPFNIGTNIYGDFGMIDHECPNIEMFYGDVNNSLALASSLDGMVSRSPLKDISIRNKLEKMFDYKKVCKEILETIQ